MSYQSSFILENCALWFYKMQLCQQENRSVFRVFTIKYLNILGLLSRLELLQTIAPLYFIRWLSPLSRKKFSGLGNVSSIEEDADGTQSTNHLQKLLHFLKKEVQNEELISMAMHGFSAIKGVKQKQSNRDSKKEIFLLKLARFGLQIEKKKAPTKN